MPFHGGLAASIPNIKNVWRLSHSASIWNMTNSLHRQSPPQDSQSHFAVSIYARLHESSTIPRVVAWPTETVQVSAQAVCWASASSLTNLWRLKTACGQEAEVQSQTNSRAKHGKTINDGTCNCISTTEKEYSILQERESSCMYISKKIYSDELEETAGARMWTSFAAS